VKGERSAMEGGQNKTKGIPSHTIFFCRPCPVFMGSLCLFLLFVFVFLLIMSWQDTLNPCYSLISKFFYVCLCFPFFLLVVCFREIFLLQFFVKDCNLCI
jgi:hypothetical protein